MFSVKTFIYMIVLAKSGFLLVSSKIIPHGQICDYQKETEFGLQINGSVRESLESLPKIIEGFISISKYPSDEEEIIKLYLDKCKHSPDCRLQIVLDKKNTKSMTLCVIGSEEEICFVSTCTCPTNRTRREIPSPLITENPISGPSIKKPTCSFKNISTKTISDKNRGNCTNPKDKMSVILKENSTIGSGSKEKKMRSYEEENKPHVSGDIKLIHGFFIGLGIGAVLGGFATFLWFKRKSTMPKIMAVVNGIYKSGKPDDDKLYLHEVTEYSEIPDLEQKNEFHQYLDSPKHITRAKFHASPSLVVPADTCEHNFQKDDKDNPGLASLKSSDESDIQQECYVKSGIKLDTYLIPSNMIDVTKNHDICIDFREDIGDVDITTKNKENKTTETHTEQLDNLNSNSTYFVLSADENKKSMVSEFTSCKDESENSKLQNTEENEETECKKVDGQDNERVYFELTKFS